MLFPLPEGEGKGKGKAMYCLPMADDFWNFQAPRVLRSSKRLHRFTMNTAKATPPEPDKKPAQSEA
ncbi:MAG: hypothetical protein DME26_19750, partial [Verrucomicrobia bacterium]